MTAVSAGMTGLRAIQLKPTHMEKVESHWFVPFPAGTNIDDIRMINPDNASVNERVLKGSVKGVCILQSGI